MGTALFLPHSTDQNITSFAPIHGSGKVNSLLDGEVASSHCRKARGIGDIVVALFREYRSVT